MRPGLVNVKLRKKVCEGIAVVRVIRFLQLGIALDRPQLTISCLSCTPLVPGAQSGHRSPLRCCRGCTCCRGFRRAGLKVLRGPRLLLHDPLLHRPRTAGPPRPHTAPTASGKRAPAARPRGRVVGGGRAPDPGRPTPRQEAPPPGTLMPPPQRARARAVGLVTGPHARSPRSHSQWVVGPGRTPERTRGRGWESARPQTPHTQARGAPPGHPHAAPTARKSARCGVGDGSPRPHPPHPQPVGSGPRPHPRTDERSGVGERPFPDAPHPGKRRPPRAPSCRPQSTQDRALWGW